MIAIVIFLSFSFHDSKILDFGLVSDDLYHPTKVIYITKGCGIAHGREWQNDMLSFLSI